MRGSFVFGVSLATCCVCKRSNFNPLGLTKRPYLLAALSGIMYGLAFPPTGLVPSFLAFVCLVPLLIAIESATRLRDAFRRGFIAMFLLGLVANYWVGGFKGIGEVDPFLMVGGILLALIHPFFLVVPLLIYDVIRRKYGPKPALYALPVLWTGFEFWHSLGDLSYPWLNLYNTQTYNLAFAQFIEYTGPYGLSMLVCAINVLVYALLRSGKLTGSEKAAPLLLSSKGRWIAVAALVLAFAIPYLHGSFVMADIRKGGEHLAVSIIQPNINPWAKWEATQDAIMDSNFRASDEALARAGRKIDLLLWPETAITFPINLPQNSEHLFRLYDYLISKEISLLTGFPEIKEYRVGSDSIPVDAKPSKNESIFYRSWNAAMLVYLDGAEFKQDHHYKQRLVPWGEHIPFSETFPFLADLFKWSVGLGSWNKGMGYAVQRLPLRDSNKVAQDTAKLWTMICYESVYPWFVREFVKNGAELLFVITNDGWYGKSSGPYQHNQFAVLRAIENRRYIARSANTGISCVIDDKGRILQETDLFVKASIHHNFPLLTKQTFYTRIGDWLAIPCMWLTVGIAAFLLFNYYRTRRSNRKLSGQAA